MLSDFLIYDYKHDNKVESELWERYTSFIISISSKKELTEILDKIPDSTKFKFRKEVNWYEVTLKFKLIKIYYINYV